MAVTLTIVVQLWLPAQMKSIRPVNIPAGSTPRTEWVMTKRKGHEMGDFSGEGRERDLEGAMSKIHCTHVRNCQRIKK